VTAVGVGSGPSGRGEWYSTGRWVGRHEVQGAERGVHDVALGLGVPVLGRCSSRHNRLAAVGGDEPGEGELPIPGKFRR